MCKVQLKKCKTKAIRFIYGSFSDECLMGIRAIYSS